MALSSVYKYRLEVMDRQTVYLPFGAEILHVAEQDDALQMWVLVDIHAGDEGRNFIITGTGHPVPDDCDYVASVLTRDGKLVWHVFEALS